MDDIIEEIKQKLCGSHYDVCTRAEMVRDIARLLRLMTSLLEEIED